MKRHLVFPMGRRGLTGPVGPVGPSGPAEGRLAPACLQNSDWDTVLTNGYYQSPPNTPNSPTTGLWYMGQVISHNSTTYVEQIVHAFTIGEIYNNRKYRRSRVNGTWLPWVRIFEEPLNVVRAQTGGGATAIAANDRLSFQTLAENRGDYYLGGALGVGGGQVVHVRTAGKYEVSGYIYRSAGQSGGRANIVRNSGAAVSWVQLQPNSAADKNVIPSAIITCNGGDQFSFQFDHATNLFLSPSHTEIQLKFLG